MAAFVFRLETTDGTPADPPKFESAVPNWRAGDTIPLGARTLRVVDVRYDEGGETAVLSSRTWPDEQLGVPAQAR